MANTVFSTLNYSNTFLDWVNVTNSEAIEINSLGKGNYTKDVGTLTLNGSGTGLSVANAVAITGGSLTLTAGQIYVQNTTTGITVAGSSGFGGTLSANNLTASGSIYFGDSLIQLANNNTGADTIDIGFYGTYRSAAASATRYAGLVRQASSGNYILFKEISSDPSSANVVSGFTTGTRATLSANLTGGQIYGLANTVGILDGGTNGSATPVAGAVAYGTGTAYAFNSAGSSGQYLQSAGASVPTWVTFSLPGALTFNNSGAGVASGTVYNGTTANTISYNSVGSPSNTGTNASGNWNINVANIYTTTANVTFYNSTSTTANIISMTVTSANITSLGVGTSPSGVSGEIRAANNITAYYTSDIRFKENVEDIPNALSAVEVIGGKLFDWTDDYIESHGGEDDYFNRKSDFGVIAQDVEKVFPRAVRQKPDGTLAVDYEKLCALAFQAIKELKSQVDELKNR